MGVTDIYTLLILLLINTSQSGTVTPDQLEFGLKPLAELSLAHCTQPFASLACSLHMAHSQHEYSTVKPMPSNFYNIDT